MLHFRRMRRGDVTDVIALLASNASPKLGGLLRRQLRASLHSCSATLVVVAIDSERAQNAIVGVAVLHRTLVLSSTRDGMVGTLSIRVRADMEEWEAAPVFEALREEMDRRVAEERWACVIEEIGEELTFV